MRKILKVFVLAMVTNVAINHSHAQLVKLPKVLAFGNLTYAKPVGGLSNIASHGFGYEIGGGIGLGNTLLMASTGNIRYQLSNNGRMNVIPWKFGLRRYLLLGLFLNGNIGLAKEKTDFDNPYSVPTEKTRFLYEAGAGFKIGLLELGAAYTGFGSNRTALLFKGGLAIKL